MSNSKPRTAQELKALLHADRSAAYEKIGTLFDAGTFVELGSYVKRQTTEFDCSDASSEFEGVVTGYGSIDGRLVFAFLQDFSRMKGAVGEMGAKKICDLYRSAMQNGAPVVGIFESAGAKVLEGIGALSGYGKIMRSVAAASGVIPQIAVVTGICAGSAATIAGMFDFVLAAKDQGKFYVNPPFAMQNECDGEALGKVETAAKEGNLTALADTAAEALASVRHLLSFLPSNNAEGTVYAMESDDANRQTEALTALLTTEGYDMKEVLSLLANNGSLFETYTEYAPEMVTALAQINSMVVGVVANQPAVKDGKLSPKAARKAAKMISFCDCFRIPVLTLVDCVGLSTCACAESKYPSALAKLASAYAASETPKVTVVLGKAYGSAYTLLGSKSIGADVAFAVDSAKISILPPEAAVTFVYGDKLRTSEDSAKAKEEATEEWNTLYASPLAAARSGDIDDIIDYAELRQRISAAFAMLSSKSEAAITKRHGNLPL